MKRAYKIYLIILAALVVGAVVIGTKGINQQKSHIYVIPGGYTGWVQIIYDQKDSPELPREGKAILHEIPNDGVLMTSSSPTSGGMSFYYADDQGGRSNKGTSLIHAQSIQTKDIKLQDGTTVQATINSFFVGTEQQYIESTVQTK